MVGGGDKVFFEDCTVDLGNCARTDRVFVEFLKDILKRTLEDGFYNLPRMGKWMGSSLGMECA